MTIPVTKHLNTCNWKNGDSFTFVLEPLAGAPMPKQTGSTTLKQQLTVSAEYNDASGNSAADVTKNFEAIPVDKAGEYIYRIQETDHGKVIEQSDGSKLSYADDPIYVKVTVEDKKANGETTAASAILTADDKDGDDASSWTHTFRDLPKTDASGNEIDYNIAEESINEYAAAPEGIDTGTGVSLKNNATVQDGNMYTITITNTHNDGERYSLSATKVWSGDTADKRSDVTLHLFKKVGENGELTRVKDEKTIPKDAVSEEERTVTWHNLPVSENNEKVTYTVKEYAISGYTASISDTTVDEDAKTMHVTVTNTYASGSVTPTPVPTPSDRHKVTYVDPKAASGNMLLSVTLYDTEAQAEQAAKQGAGTGGSDNQSANASENASGGKMVTAAEAAAAEAERQTDGGTDDNSLMAQAIGAGKPSDPLHEGYTFLGWDLNEDPYGDFVLVALYSDPVPDKTPVVTYVDGQSGKPILKTVFSDDPYSVKAPKDPKHKNLIFVGWREGKDADGNTIFVAHYKPDCSNGGGSDDDSGSSSRSGSGDDKTSSGSSTNTGDRAHPFIYMIIMGAAILTAAFVLAARRYMLRRRKLQQHR